MKVILCGGGSGGHITPLLAVAAELRKQHKDIRLIYIGERAGKFGHIAESSELFDEHHYISAGKLRRYHGESFFRRLLDVKTLILNIRDVFRLLAGLLQSYWLLKGLKADTMLLKGGFVCVPVALAARLTGVPFVTHDSDALPGLSNRIAGRWAKYHATAMPAQYYSYPNSKIRVVGVPTDERFRSYTDRELEGTRMNLNIPKDAQVLLVTGGSNGARRLNDAVIQILPELLDSLPTLLILHQIGGGNSDQTEALPKKYAARVRFFDFSTELFHMSAIAEVVIARAGASAVADLAAQSKACIIVPNPYLTGGHQLKNAKVYEDAQAAIIIQEKDLLKDPNILLKTVIELMQNKQRRDELSANLHRLTPNDNAAKSLADLLLEIV